MLSKYVFQKQYKGTSQNYGEYGHKSGECPDKEAGRVENSQFRDKCWCCGKYGHKAGNYKKRLEEGGSSNGRAAVAIEEVKDLDGPSVSKIGYTKRLVEILTFQSKEHCGADWYF